MCAGSAGIAGRRLTTSACIYCLRKAGPFTKEHVIPQAFGLFGPATMVLKKAVCHDCNQGFGRDLDLVLARDSYEGLLRADIFPRTSRARDQFQPRRTVMKFPDEPPFGELRGLRLHIDWSVRRPRLLAQVVLCDRGGKREQAIPIDELSMVDPALFRNRSANAVQIFAPTPESCAQLQSRLQGMGVRFRSRPTHIELPPALRTPSVVLEIEGTIDIRVRRAIGKIAFNYLAHIQGSQSVLSATFDEMRKFVRGDGPPPAGQISMDPILMNDKRARPSHEMHIVLVDRDRQDVWGRVSLFNSFSYHIRMSRDTIIWYELRSGHTFDPIAKAIHKLTPIPKALRPPRVFMP